MFKSQVVKHILRHANFIADNAGASAWAPSNVALIKYWGKRDPELNLPITSSLSIALGKKGTHTFIREVELADQFEFNAALIDPASKFAIRLRNFLDLFRPPDVFYQVLIKSNVPLAAGMASSACGFASLVLALNGLYGWNLEQKDLSILARLGSGSACRSLWNGFVKWHAGVRSDGLDCFALPLPHVWPELRIGALMVSAKEKPISSTEAMQVTLNTSSMYSKWPAQVAQDLIKVENAISQYDFALLGSTAEANALFMHKMMREAKPSINYALAETVAIMEQIAQLRRAGVNVYFTQDAGPNLQLLFLNRDLKTICNAFSSLDVIIPFPDKVNEELIVVDSNDQEIDVAEKMVVHLQGKLHRAFSVVIYRYNQGKLEVLLQQRSSEKYHSANLWSNSCCGHPRPNEKTQDAAERRLFEEMGMRVNLREVGVFHYQAKLTGTDLIENEIDHVFVAELSNSAINPDPNEIQNYKWVELSKLQRDLNQNPNKYTVWLPEVVHRLSQANVF